MFTSALEDSFRAALGARATVPDQESVDFATAFTRLVVRVLSDEVDAASAWAVADAIAARTNLGPEAIDGLLGLALAPENRTEISGTDLEAVRARFGMPAEMAVRHAVADEVDLEAFAARYGPAESLLLLDSLFAVSAARGGISDGALQRLQHAAARLPVDPMLVGLLLRKHDPRRAEGDQRFDLSGRTSCVIGRAAPADLILPDPQVATRHVHLEREEGGWRVLALSRGRPTRVNGEGVHRARLQPGDELGVGPYRLMLRDDTLTAFGARAVSSLSVQGLSRSLHTPQGPITLLDDVRFTAFTGEVVALVGPSGAGKTTLLQAITGIAPADTGQVRLDGHPFHRLLASDRSLVGIVPQDDIVHGELTVQEALRYAAKLRLGGSTDSADLDKAVERVMAELDLTRIRDQRIGSTMRRGISGGQRKRVNLGQELLTRTTRVLFLDEPTSGLDPQTAQEIVSQVRHLADHGRLVFLVTHDVAPSLMAKVDHLLVLAPGGRMAWFGPPSEALDYFEVKSVDGIFGALGRRPAADWGARFQQSPAFRKYVRTREHLLGLGGSTTTGTHQVVTPGPKNDRMRPYLTLVRRYATVKMRDWVGTGVLLVQAPLLALAFAVVFPHADAATVFVLVLSSLWFGASAAVRELIAERQIWRRESRVGLRLLPYLASKVTVLGAIVTVQCVVLTASLWWALDMGAYGFSLPALAGVTTAVGLTGMSLGLLVSAAFSSSEAAVGMLPLVLIPQIAFSGLLVKIKEMSALATLVSWAMVTRFGFEAALKTGEELYLPGRRGLAARPERVSARLYEIGFKATSDATDMGLAMPTLMGILALFCVVCLAGTAVLTDRARRGS